MLPKDLKKRLAQLNRSPIAARPIAKPAAVEPLAPESAVPEPMPELVPQDGAVERMLDPAARGAILAPDPCRGPEVEFLRLPDAAPGRVVECRGGGTYWLIERRLLEIAPGCESFVRRYREVLGCEIVLVPEGLRRDLIAFLECRCDRVLYLDIETTSLSGVRPLFLVGVMFFDGEDFVVRQYFARHYGEEEHLLADLATCMPNFDMLVTFNGRSFDAPYIADRVKSHHLEIAWPPHHFDMLFESRRRWRGLLPNCRLVTLEEFICNRRRIDDIPSRLIPAAYHEFVHTEEASKMRYVIHHNALDLVTMAELALFMLTGRRDWG